jgi:hypothetical protein
MEPALEYTLASALSFLGNHSATVFVAAGKISRFAETKSYSAIAKPIQPIDLVIKACSIPKMLQITIDSV